MSKIMMPPSALDDDQRRCLEVLEQCVEQAQAGNINSIGVVVCMKEGWTTIIAGRRAGDLYLGTGDLQQRILEEVKSGNVSRRSRSPLIKMS